MFPSIEPTPFGFLGYIYSTIGNREKARQILEKLQNHAQQAHEFASSFALIYFGLGETDKGFDWLDKAVEDLQPFLLVLINHSCLDPLRSHPRYKALLRKMNLEQ